MVWSAVRVDCYLGGCFVVYEFVRWEVVIVVGCMCSSVEGEFSVRRCCKAASGETTAVER